MPDREKTKQEQRPLMKIEDNFKKIIIMKDSPTTWYTDEGVLVMSMRIRSMSRTWRYAAVTFKPKFNAVFYGEDDDSDYYLPIAGKLSTEDLFFKTYRQKKLLKAFERMKPTTRRLIEYVYGVCPDCLGNKKN